MIRSSLRVLALATAATAITAPAASAAVTVGGKCFIYADASLQQPMPVTVDGLAPGQAIRINMNRGKKKNIAFASAAADGNGVASTGFSSWFPQLGSAPKQSSITVDAVDAASGSLLGTGKAKVANLAISVKGKNKNRTWKISGLAAITKGSTYYAHYFNNGRYKGRLKIGKTKNSCGYLTATRPLTPFSKLGRYDVKVTTTKKYSDADPAIGGRVVVTKKYC